MERGIPESVLSDLTITALRDYYVESEEFQQTISEHSRRWSAPPDDSQRPALLARIAALDTELGRLTGAIVAGKAPASIVKPSRSGSRRRPPWRPLRPVWYPRSPWTLPACVEAIEQLVPDLLDEMGQTPAKTQQNLSRILTGPIAVTWDGSGWDVAFEAVLNPCRGSRWCPRGDSNTRHAV